MINYYILRVLHTKLEQNKGKGMKDVCTLTVFGAYLAKKYLRKKHKESIDLSLSLDRTFVTKSP